MTPVKGAPAALRVPVTARMQYWLWRSAAAIVTRLPVNASYRVAWVVGSAGYYLWPRGRRSMHRNYRWVLPQASPAEIRRVARRSLVNYCCYLADFLRFPSLPKEEILEIVHGEEEFQRLDAPRAEGRGVVIACMHFGNWDIGAAATVALGYPVTVVGETFADPRLDAMIIGARTEQGMRVLKMEKAGPSLVRPLQRRELLALLIDRPLDDGGVRVTFFGEPVEVPAGPARLAIRTGAKVVAVGFPRLSTDRMSVTTLADFGIETPAGSGDEDVRNLTQAIMDAHERFIRRYPDQWYMFREMWPRRRQRSTTHQG